MFENESLHNNGLLAGPNLTYHSWSCNIIVCLWPVYYIRRFRERCVGLKIKDSCITASSRIHAGCVGTNSCFCFVGSSDGLVRIRTSFTMTLTCRNLIASISSSSTLRDRASTAFTVKFSTTFGHLDVFTVQSRTSRATCFGLSLRYVSTMALQEFVRLTYIGRHGNSHEIACNSIYHQVYS